jgi:hypothetical protein
VNQFVPLLSCKKVFASNALVFTLVALMLITLLAASQLAVNMGEARSFLLIVGLVVFYDSLRLIVAAAQEFPPTLSFRNI